LVPRRSLRRGQYTPFDKKKAMQVETFEVMELDHEGQVECDAEAIALIEKMDLGGQKKMIKGADGDPKSRLPYRKMTAEELFVYERLCPKKTKLNQYDDGPIPLRCLQVAAHAIEFFDSIEVWSATDADVKDPVLVGIKGQYAWETGYSQFILARWGEVLEPFAMCLKQAAQKFRDQYKAVAAKGLADLQAAATVIDNTPDGACVGKTLPRIEM
jgi:hypothetical protein